MEGDHRDPERFRRLVPEGPGGLWMMAWIDDLLQYCQSPTGKVGGCG